MASHNANEEKRQEAYILRKLKSLSAWRGSLFDKGIELFVIPAIENSKLIDWEWVAGQTLELARRQFAFSKAKKYRFVSQSAAGEEFCALLSHENGLSVPSEELKEVFEHIVRCFDNLSRQTEFVDYLRWRKWYGVQIPLSFSLDGVTVAAQPDLLFFRGKGQLTLVEWKTGVSETSYHRPQLLVYALAACKKWPDARLEELEICEANLMKNEIQKHHVTEKDLLQIEDFIFLSISEIKALTRGEGFLEQHLEDYEFANNPNTCQCCSFRKICLEVISEDASNQFIRDSEPVQLELPL
jgi:hypothetical protein